MTEPSVPYYRRDLARVHHLGFAFHAEACAPGILRLLEPVRRRNGLVVEIGCGSGLLTRALVDAGHRVVATDASPAMLELAEQWAGGAEEIRQLTLPDDPLPEADAIVGVGHALNYLPDAAAIDWALAAMARPSVQEVCWLSTSATWPGERRGAVLPTWGWWTTSGPS